MVSCAARSERVTSSETEWLITSHSLRRNLLSSIPSLFQDMDLYIYERVERQQHLRSFERLSGISIGRQVVKREIRREVTRFN